LPAKQLHQKDERALIVSLHNRKHVCAIRLHHYAYTPIFVFFGIHNVNLFLVLSKIIIIVIIISSSKRSIHRPHFTAVQPVPKTAPVSLTKHLLFSVLPITV
jgi:hypothetical protein